MTHPTDDELCTLAETAIRCPHAGSREIVLAHAVLRMINQIGQTAAEMRVQADPYGDAIARVGRNLAACRELGVNFGPGYVSAFMGIDRMWTIADF